MKHLPKHLRPRYRYLVVELLADSPGDIDSERFQRELWDATRALYGDLGSAEIDPTVVRFDLDAATGSAIVRTRRDETARARAAVACIDSVDGVRLGCRVLGICGTIRACEEKYR